MTHKYFVLTFLAVALLVGLPLSAPAGVRYKVLHNFGSGKDGVFPYGPLVFGPTGNLYGSTYDGGTGPCSLGCGTVFELRPQANRRWREALLHNFSAHTGGSAPWGGIVLDSSGNLYGTMQGDSSFAIEGVYELSPGLNGWNFAVLYSQDPGGGGFAGPGLLMDGLGNLYGEIGHGQDTSGAIGELWPGSGGWNYTQLYSFCSGNGCPDGEILPAPPIWDSKGNMFGTTEEGGIYKSPCQTYLGCGVIYKMTPNGDGTWTYHVLHRFASFKNDGQNPYSGLVMDKAGNFYGATIAGGAYGFGTVFKFANTSGKWKETVLHSFSGDCTYGCGVEGTLALDKSGNLYGTAGGGTGNCGYACGVVFKLAPQKNGKWKYSVVYNFTAAGGGFQPFYGVIVDGKGHLFGVTSQFGKYGGGTAFEIIP